jgi:hypothetical protein
MTLFPRRLNRPNAQSTLEYAIIAALVAAGIIIGGPFVKRSWNATMRMFDDSTQDSFNDPFENADPVGGEITCECDAVEGGAPDTCGHGNCGTFEYRTARDCFPIGCEDAQETCTESYLCCSAWVEDGCASNVTRAKPCAVGKMAYWRQCGGDVTESKCESDETCNIECLGVTIDKDTGEELPGDPNAEWCFPGDADNDDVPDYKQYLKESTNVIYKNKESKCPNKAKNAQCTAYCKGGMTSTTTGCDYKVPRTVFTIRDRNSGRTVCRKGRQPLLYTKMKLDVAYLPPMEDFTARRFMMVFPRISVRKQEDCGTFYCTFKIKRKGDNSFRLLLKESEKGFYESWAYGGITPIMCYPGSPTTKDWEFLGNYKEQRNGWTKNNYYGYFHTEDAKNKKTDKNKRIRLYKELK